MITFVWVVSWVGSSTVNCKIFRVRLNTITYHIKDSVKFSKVLNGDDLFASLLQFNELTANFSV